MYTNKPTSFDGEYYYEVLKKNLISPENFVCCWDKSAVFLITAFSILHQHVQESQTNSSNWKHNWIIHIKKFGIHDQAFLWMIHDIEICWKHLNKSVNDEQDRWWLVIMVVDI